jgi:predicted TIM-barrel fold metal-dependent hydrolase
MKLISVDDHVIEHGDVWESRLPAAYRERGPRLIEADDGLISATGEPVRRSAHIWIYEGKVHLRSTTDAVAGRPRTEYNREPYRFDEIRPGCYDPVERVKDMDVDGVQAQLCFPTFPRFSGTAFLASQDKELGLLCVQAYNDFMIEEWCQSAPDRFIPLVLIPLWDPVLAVREIERTAAKGAKAVAFPENPVPLGLPSFHTDHWDPVFAAAQEADLPLCMHFGTSGSAPTTAPDAPFTVMITLMGSNSLFSAVDLLFSPVFHKFDRLKVALSEGGIGWMPYMLERADNTWERHKFYTGIDLETRPSDLFRRHIWGCFIEDEVGIRERHTIGLDHITWEGDYPHSDSLWPHSRKRAEELLADVPDEEAHQIVELNARRLFNFNADL